VAIKFLKKLSLQPEAGQTVLFGLSLGKDPSAATPVLPLVSDALKSEGSAISRS
jgi:hypothetical protein